MRVGKGQSALFVCFFSFYKYVFPDLSILSAYACSFNSLLGGLQCNMEQLKLVWSGLTSGNLSTQLPVHSSWLHGKLVILIFLVQRVDLFVGINVWCNWLISFTFCLCGLCSPWCLEWYVFLCIGSMQTHLRLYRWRNKGHEEAFLKDMNNNVLSQLPTITECTEWYLLRKYCRNRIVIASVRKSNVDTTPVEKCYQFVIVTSCYGKWSVER